MLGKRSDKSPSKERIVEPEFSFELEVKKLAALLQTQDPRTFSPRWIQEQDAGLYRSLRTMVTDEYGLPDWWQVISRLEPKWHRRVSWNESSAPVKDLRHEVAALQALLEREQPVAFTADWIRKKDNALYRRLVRQVSRSGKTADWSRVIELLNEGWRGKMVLPTHTERDKDLAAEVKILVELLNKNRPLTFDPTWIRDRDKNLYERLRQKVEGPSRAPDWSRVVSLLGRKWEKRMYWDEKVGTDRTLNEEVETLTALLNKRKPGSFSPDWINREDRNLYVRLIDQIRDERGVPDWSRVSLLLEARWSMRFSRKTGVEVGRSLEDEGRTLAALARREEVEELTPGQIPKYDLPLYHRIKRRIRRPDGSLDWSRITRTLDEDVLARKWKEAAPRGSRRFEKSLPKAAHHDPEAVKTLLDSFKTKLYVFFTPLTSEDRALRERICRELILLARTGNDAAAEELVDLLIPMVEEWKDHDQELAPYMHDVGSVRDRLLRCIHLFDMDGDASFITYLASSLKRAARGLKHQVADDLDRPLGKSWDLKLSDTTAYEEPVEDNED